MKRKIFTLALALLSSIGAFAQLKPGSLAPNIIWKDINGNTFDLYSLLNSGKTVFIDVSAAWCGPCWSYHNSGNLENLYKQHGPAGYPNVNASTTDDVMVVMIEAEGTNTRAQLYGTSSGTANATFSQGDWVTGTPYPILDTNAAYSTAFKTAWNIGYFPTIYMVCRDRLVQEVGQLTTAALYAKATTGGVCPTYAPSGTVDAKTVTYTGGTFYTCNANPTVRFQNYSTTQSISAATIKTYSGTTLVNTYAWSGTAVPPYGIASVTVPPFMGTTWDNYNYEVVVAGDTKASNNVSTGSTFRVYLPTNAGTTPWSETFEAASTMPAKMTASTPEIRTFNTDGTYTLKGINGATTRGLLLPFIEATPAATWEIALGNFNTASATNVTLEFDYSYFYAAGKPAKLEMKVSKDCGATWATVWSKADAALATTTNYSGSGPYLPSAGSDWRHDAVSLTAQKGNHMMVKLVGTGTTTNKSQYAWMDNIKITNTLSVANVVANGSVSLYPNPARESATLEFTLSNSSKVVVSVLDALGRTVSVVSDATLQQGAQHFNIPTSSLAAGVYNITIRTEEGILTQRLSVVK